VRLYFHMARIRVLLQVNACWSGSFESDRNVLRAVLQWLLRWPRKRFCQPISYWLVAADFSFSCGAAGGEAGEWIICRRRVSMGSGVAAFSIVCLKVLMASSLTCVA